MLVPQDEVTLLSYFKTADKPTQDQYEELIRTMFYLMQVAIDDAADALAAANAIAPRTPVAFAMCVHPGGGGTTYNIDNSYNVTSVVTMTGPSRARITFTNPLANNDYLVQVTPFSSSAHPDQIQLVARTVNNVDIAIYDGAAFLNQVTFSIAIFRAT